MYGFGEIIDRLVSIDDKLSTRNNTKKQSNVVVEKINLYEGREYCEKCGADITEDKLKCHVCGCAINKNTNVKSAMNIEENIFCVSCGANISNDLDNCHVCGQKIKD